MSLKTPLAHNRLKRNVFDLSERHLFTGSIGELLPCYVKECVPGDKFVIKPQVFLRTMPMQTASFVRLKQTVEFFKVPYRLLWSKFPQYISGTKYDTSTYFKTTGLSLPMFSLYSKVPSKADSNKTQRFDSFSDYLINNSANAGFHSSEKLMDLLGYGFFDPSDPSSLPPTRKSALMVSPFRFLAYQKIYQDFYRNPLYEDQDVTYTNIDSIANGSNLVPSDIFNGKYDSSFNKYFPIFQLRYRNLKSDYFTNNRPSFAGALWMSSTATIRPVLLPNADSYSQHGPTQYNSQSLMWLDATPAEGESTFFSINNLRSAYALDKLIDNTQRSKDGCYVHQMESRFGIKPRVDDFHSIFLGGCDAPVQIGEVVSTSAEGSAPLGTIGGKAMSFNNGNIEFECDEHCIIMGILSLVPEVDYPSYGVDREVMKSYREEFFTPEFQDLGFQPTYYGEFSSSHNEKRSLAHPEHDDMSVLGWNPRYSEYKTGIDKVYGSFNREQSLHMWCAPYNSHTSYDQKFNVEDLKVNPSMFDTLFYVNYDGTSKNDQFLFNANFDVKAIRPMSVSGLPYAN